MTQLTFNKKFKPLFDLPEGVRYYVITGGRFSSKSFSASTAVCLAVNNQNRKALYSRYTSTSAKDSIIPEFSEKIEMLGLGNYYETKLDRIVGIDNREVVFKGLRTSSGNQTARLKSLKGFSMFVLDEAEEENDETSFDRINLSIRQNDVNNIIILILNPTTKTHWIYKRFFEDKGVKPGSNIIKDNVCYIHTTYLDALSHVPSDYLTEIDILRKSNPLKFEHVIMGGWLDAAEGVVFTDWEYGDFDNSLPFGYGMDFGYFPDPDTVIKVAVDNKAKKIYCKEEFFLNNAGVDLLAETMKKTIDVNKVVYADSKENRLIPDLKLRGIKGIVAVNKPAGSVMAGIKLMQGYKIIVHPDSKNIATELNNYVWKNGIPCDLYNHRIDAIRYYVQSVIKSTIKRTIRCA